MGYIILIFVSRRIWDLAIQKDQKPFLWVFYNILAWFVAGTLGSLLAMLLFGAANQVASGSIGLLSAFGGYLFIRAILEKKPDHVEEDIDRINVDDLQPPTNK